MPAGIDIVLGANVGAYTAAMRTAEAGTRQLVAAAAQATTNATRLESASAAAAARAASFGTATSAAATAARQAATALATQAAQARAAATAAQSLANASAATTQQLRQQTAASMALEDRTLALRDSLREVAAPAAVAFAGLVAGIAAATKAFGDFEAVLNQTKAVSGATASEMESLKAQALGLGAATAFSAREAAQAQAELAKSGMDVNQTLAATPGVLALAAAGQLDVAKAAEVTGAALNGFGLGAEKAGYVADLLAKAANASALSVEDVGESLKYASTIAASTSQSLDDVAQLLAIMGNAGIKGSQGGTVFRAAIASLAKPSDDAAQKLNGLKISIQDTGGKMLPLADIIGQLRDKTAKLSEVQRANAVATIFGTEAMSGILAVMKQSPAELEKVSAAFANVSGQAAETAGIFNSGFKGAMDQLSGSVETAAITMGEQFAPAIIAVANGIKGAVDAFTGLDPNVKSLIAGAVAATTALAGLVAIAATWAAGAAVLGPALVAAGGAAGVLAIALGPVGIGIAALAVTVGVATVAFRNNTIAGGETAAALRKQQDETNALAAEHEKLKAKIKPTVDEQKRMKEIIEKLTAISPALVSGFNKQGEATDVDKAAIDRWNDAARERLGLLQQTAAQQRITTNASLASATLELRAALANEQGIRQRQALNKDAQQGMFGFLAGIGEKNLENESAANRQRIISLKATVADLQTQASKQADEAAGGVSAEASWAVKPKRGDPPPPPGKKGGGRKAGATASPRPGVQKDSTVEKAADEAIKKQAEALAALNTAYQRSLQIAQAWGGGTAAEVTLLTKLMADIKAKGLDKVVEGQEAVINAQTRLNVIAGNQSVAKNAKAAEDAKKKEAEQVAAVMGQVEMQLAFEKSAADERKRIQDEAEKAAERFTGSIRDMQAEVVALATDPSVERVANFAKSLIADEDKLTRYSKAIEDVGKAFGGASGKANDFGAAVGKIAGAINPVTIALGVVTALALGIKAAFDNARESQEALRASAISTAREIRDLETDLTVDPAANTEAKKTNAREDLNNELLAEMKARKDKMKSGVAYGSINERLVGDLRIDNMTIDDFADLKKKQALRLAAIDKQFNETVNGGKAGATSNIERMADNAMYDQQRLEDAFNTYDDMLDRLGEINKELSEGGRDDWGRKITLGLERQQKLLQQQEDSAKRLNSLADRKLNLEEDLAQLKLDAAKAIKDIENEGIAVRALSESQDKGVRIERVKADYAKKRLDITGAITEVNDDITRATQEAEQALSRINIQYQERFAALEKEAAKLTANVLITQQQLGIERDITAEIASREARKSRPAAQPSQRSTPGAATGSTTYRQQYFHTGGTMPDLRPGEQQAVIKKNEFILTPPQMNHLLAAAAGGQRGGFSMGDVNISITAAPGMDGRAVGNMAWDTIAARARRGGFGR